MCSSGHRDAEGQLLQPVSEMLQVTESATIRVPMVTVVDSVLTGSSEPIS